MIYYHYSLYTPILPPHVIENEQIALRSTGDDTNSARGVGIVGDFFRPVLHNHLHALGYIKSSVDNIDTSVYHWYVKLYRALGERGLGATHPLIVFGTETVQNPPHKHTHSLRNGGLHGRELYNLFLIFCFCLYFKIGPRPDFDITRLCYY